MRRLWTVLPLLTLLSTPVYAQDFGVMESAETVNQGNFKLRVNPLVFFGRNGGDDEVGVAGVVGYGFTPRFDLEGGLVIGDGVRIVGATAEFNVVRNDDVSFSVIPGFHVRRGDRTLHTTGIDLLFLGSTHVTSRLDFYGGLDLAFERSDIIDYETVHLVPGLEYKLHRDVELLVEFGLGLNDDSLHYLSGGLAFYFR
jgi:hypothetical protein